MPFILIQVAIFNNSDFPIVWLDDGHSHGDWQDPWFPSKIKNLKKGENASFRIESAGDIPIFGSIGTGAEGWALFKVAVPPDPGLGDLTEYLTLNFDRPFIELKKFNEAVDYQLYDPRGKGSRHPGPQKAYAVSLGIHDLANEENVGEILGAIAVEIETAGLGTFVEAPFLLATDSFAKHLLWVVEVRNAGEGQATFPLKAPDKGIIYAITKRTTELGRRLGSGVRITGGDLNWYRHDGRLDGTFVWQGPDKVGVRWDGLQQVFSGGEGIVYGITPRVDSSLPAVTQTISHGGSVIPAHGGDLLWYKHLGWQDGSFQWDGPKVVGTRWDQLAYVFSAGGGILYGIDKDGDLLWYRHTGWKDGNFTWEGPKKVGIGWSGLARVFSGGDGIIYGVTGNSRITLKVGESITGGGDLLWFRHLGWQDGTFRWEGPKKVGSGWGNFEQLFCDEEGVLYGVTPHVDAKVGFGVTAKAPGSGVGVPIHQPTPASGGDLLWYKHLGRETGTWDWEGPKKVGVGWDGLHLAFSGGVLPVSS